MSVPSASSPRPPVRSILHLFGLEPGLLHAHEKTLLLLATGLTATAFVIGFSDVSGRYGGIDLRNRVVGARVLAAGKDPYSFRWQPGMSEQWLDPVQRGDIPRVTVPPTVLCLYQSIVWLPYGTLRLVHFGLEWAALLAAIAILAPTIPGRRWRVVFLIVAAATIALGAAWRMHTERGQLYALHALLLAIGVRSGMRSNLDSWRAGIAFGLAIALRPNFAPLGLAFLVLGKYRTAGGAIATAFAAIVLTLPWAGVSDWKSYMAMGDMYYRSMSLPEETPPEQGGPVDAEGFWFGSVIVDPSTPSSSFARFYAESRKRFGLPMINLGTTSKAAILGMTAVLIGLLITGRHRRSPRVVLLLILAFLLDLEYFLPHRWPYADVHWLVPLALAVPLFRSPRPTPQAALLCVLGALVIGNSLALATHSYTTSLARTYLLASGLTILAVWAWFHPNGRPQMEGASG